jgi:hypothetical protein
MSFPDLQQVAQAVVSRAQQQGYVVPHEVREELAQAGLPEEHWKDVVDRARASLSYRRGRYYFVPAAVARLRERSRQDQSLQQALRKAIREVIQQYKKVAVDTERRQHDRIQMLQPIKVITAEGRELSLLSRDLSLTGMRLLSTHDLLGQKVKVLIPRTDNGANQWCFLVHILWTNLVADGLYESGGMFIEVVPDGGRLRVVGTDRGD